MLPITPLRFLIAAICFAQQVATLNNPLSLGSSANLTITTNTPGKHSFDALNVATASSRKQTEAGSDSNFLPWIALVSCLVVPIVSISRKDAKGEVKTSPPLPNVVEHKSEEQHIKSALKAPTSAPSAPEDSSASEDPQEETAQEMPTVPASPDSILGLCEKICVIKEPAYPPPQAREPLHAPPPSKRRGLRDGKKQVITVPAKLDQNRRRVRFSNVQVRELIWESSGPCKHGIPDNWSCRIGEECELSIADAETQRQILKKASKDVYVEFGRHFCSGPKRECCHCDAARRVALAKKREEQEFQAMLCDKGFKDTSNIVTSVLSDES